MWLRFYKVEKLEYLSSIVFHTAILKMLEKRQKSRNVASLLYRGRLRYYIEDKVGVCIIDSFPQCHTKIFQKRQKSRNVASFLYRGRTKLENPSSIVFHTVLLKMLSKMAKIKICDFVSA